MIAFHANLSFFLIYVDVQTEQDYGKPNVTKVYREYEAVVENIKSRMRISTYMRG